MSKRPISSFFTKLPPPQKRPRLTPPPSQKEISSQASSHFQKDISSETSSHLHKELSPEASPQSPPSTHPSYPHPISSLPPTLYTLLTTLPPPPTRPITKPSLNLTFHHPFLPSKTSKQLYTFLRASLPFYRVTYSIKRDNLSTVVNTPRYTTVFGVDSNSYFHSNSSSGSGSEGLALLDTKSNTPVPKERYKACICPPRPIPQCLEILKSIVERETGERYNFILVNYYADSSDSIAFHSDDESFLGPNPTIASLSLGTTRDFLMKHKSEKSLTLKLSLNNGEMVVMKGETQRMWMHSIPKRANTIKGGWTGGGRVNITFRKGVKTACTMNYYRYNVGDGGVFRWDDGRGEMVPFDQGSSSTTTAAAADDDDDYGDSAAVKEG
ncbi:hypothetical protein TWF730_003299 [Orbilia blumenaviensis]|uniref:Fe2OG dioxygenase domain-containing protein n=1 Tax=Orbilia blumenaviensis TaxID=1796055 RepID=A0AAV9U7Z9_9PEZI